MDVGPLAPSSVDPTGIPTRPTGPVATMPVGDEAEAVGRAKAVLAPDMQVPETVPVWPPSKVVANPVVEGVVDPVADEVPVIGAPMDRPGIGCGDPSIAQHLAADRATLSRFACSETSKGAPSAATRRKPILRGGLP